MDPSRRTLVTLSDNTAAKPTFTAPLVIANTLLTFSLVVKDNDGASSTSTPDKVDITVQNVNQAQFAINGFYVPVDMRHANADVIVNMIEWKIGGNEVWSIDQNNIEQTSTSVIQSFKQNKISCSALSGDPTDAVQITNTGGTSLRYVTDGTFLANLKTPSGEANNCYSATVTTIDGSYIAAYFKLK